MIPNWLARETIAPVACLHDGSFVTMANMSRNGPWWQCTAPEQSTPSLHQLGHCAVVQAHEICNGLLTHIQAHGRGVLAHL